MRTKFKGDLSSLEPPGSGSCGTPRQSPVDFDIPALRFACLVAFGINPAVTAAAFAELPVLLAHISVDGGGRVSQDDLILAVLLGRGGCFRPLLAFEDGGFEPVVKPPVVGFSVGGSWLQT